MAHSSEDQPIDTGQRIADQRLVQAVRAGDAAMLLQALVDGANPNQAESKDSPHWPTPIFEAGAHEDEGLCLELTRILLNFGADPNDSGQEDSWWPLSQAVARQNTAWVRLLVQFGATVAATLDCHRSTVLHDSAELGDLEIVRILVEHTDGRDWLNCFDYLNRTPLACAAFAGHLEVARYLIEAGTDVNANDEDMIGETALVHAIDDGRSLAMVQLLIDAGADPTITGWCGLTALDRAKKWAALPDATDDDRRILAILRNAAGDQSRT